MFKDIFEVRKALRFKLQSSIIYRNVEIDKPDNENLLKDFYKSYKEFTELLLKDFCKKEEVIAIDLNIGNNVFADAFKKAGIYQEKINKNKIQKEKEYTFEWFNIIQFSHKLLEELFLSDFIENRKEIKYEKNGKKKQHSYITFGDLGEKNFLKKYFEIFFEESELYLKELELFKDEGLENKSRRSDILFLVQKINSREHLGKLYVMFEKNYIEHKVESSIINKLKNTLSDLKDIVEKLLVELKSSQSFGVPVEHVSLNYYSVNKTPKELSEDVNKKLKENNLEKKYKWIFGEENEESEKSIVNTFNLKNHEVNILKLMQEELQEEIDIKELKEKVKIFKAKQKAGLTQLLQNGKGFTEVWDKNKKCFYPFDFEFMGEKIEKFQVILFPEMGIIEYKQEKNNYERMLDLTNQIEKENNKEERKRLKMKRGNFFQFNLKTFKNYSEAYKKIAGKYGRDSAEIKSLKRQKIDAIKLRGWGFLSKENNNYFINTFDIENSKGVFKEIKNIKEDGNDIKIFILSSITLKALDKLCFKKDSSFIKTIDTRDFNEKVTYDNGRSVWQLKKKSTLQEEDELIKFYIHILEKQNSLNIKYRSENSLNILKKSKDSEEFEINLKLETYQLIEKNISKNTYENILKEYNGNSYKITSYDLEKGLETKKYTKWWFDFWKEENKSDKYTIRINPELMVFFKEKDEDFEKENINITKNRRLKDRFILSTSFSFHSDKSYIDSAFINEEKRKASIKDFNKIFNDQNKLDYFYGLDKGINELITLGVFKGNGKKIDIVNISEKIPVYKITSKGLSYFEYIKDDKTGEIVLDKITGEKKKRYLSKNVSYFVKDLENKELFEKQEIISCLGDLTYAKLIKGNIILNADIFTTLNLYKVTAKRFLNDALTKGNIESEKVLYDKNENHFYYEYLDRGNKNKKVILYWKEEFNFLPFSDEYKNFKEEVANELNQYIKNIKLFLKDSKTYLDLNSENISIQKINNYKNAISANIVGIIVELQKYFNGYICYETLDEGQILKKGLSTFIGNIVNEKIYNRLQLNLEVPPILKKFRTDIGIKGCTQHGKVVYINEKNTSSACPICNINLLKEDDKGNLIDKNHNEIFKLGGHLSDFENKMKHLTDGEYQEWLKNESFRKENLNKKGNVIPNKYQAGTINGKSCDYHIGNKNYLEFNFIKSGDDLATYNIAKKAKQNLEHLSKNS